MGWIPLLKTGTFTDRHGTTHTFTRDDLRGIADRYDPSAREAHLVVGHPDRNRVPSFGVVDKLKAVGDVLFFRPRKVAAEFAALVRQGKFPRVSIGLDRHPGGVLDHVAFLSAQDAAVPGLGNITSLEFSSPVADTCLALDITDVASAEPVEMSSGGLGEFAARLYRELFLDVTPIDRMQGTESFEAPQFSRLPRKGDMEYKDLFEQEREKNLALEGEKVELSKSVTTLTGERDTLKGENEQLKAKVAELEDGQVRVEMSAYVEKLIDDRKVLPDRKDSVVKRLMQLRELSAKPEFSAGDKKSPLDEYKEELEAGPAVAPAQGEDRRKGPEFSAGGESAAEIGRKARELIAESRAKGVELSASEAVARVKAQ